MSVNYTIRPIGGIWPGRRTLPGNRKRSPFKAIYTRILSDLSRELKVPSRTGDRVSARGLGVRYPPGRPTPF
jgi:hypothetical protein